MLLTLDEHDPRPLYAQIASAVRAALREGRLQPGERLPPTRELATALAVNLDTVQRAYRLLSEDGIIESRVGRGTRVRDELPAGAVDLTDEVEALLARGRELGLDPEAVVGLLRRAAARQRG